MAREIRRTGDPGQNFVEETADSQNSIELTFNAKGKCQHSIKLYFKPGEESLVIGCLKDIDKGIRATFKGQMAGEE